MRYRWAPLRFLPDRVRALLFVCLTLASASTPAQTVPNRAISLIVSSATGAGVDFFARLLADQLPSRLGQAIIVDNRPGASGMIAAALAARATPDGQTLFLMPNTLVIAPYVLAPGATSVNCLDAFLPVILPVTTDMILAINGAFANQSAITDLASLVSYARQHPGLPYASGVNGSPMHILGEQLKRAAAIDLVHVPYKGVAQAVSATVGGQLNLVWMPTSGNLQFFRSGRLHALGNAAPRRSALMPEVPTMVESGYAQIQATAWFGVLTPVNTPATIIERLNHAINAVLGLPQVRDRLQVAGYQPVGGAPSLLAQQMQDDDRRYRQLVHDYDIKAD